MVTVVERAMEAGHSVLIENMGETIDAVLNPVITRYERHASALFGNDHKLPAFARWPHTGSCTCCAMPYATNPLHVRQRHWLCLTVQPCCSIHG
jgi:hypothetical protein